MPGGLEAGNEAARRLYERASSLTHTRTAAAPPATCAAPGRLRHVPAGRRLGRERVVSVVPQAAQPPRAPPRDPPGPGQPGRGEPGRPATVLRRHVEPQPGPRHAAVCKATVPADMTLLHPVPNRQLVLLDLPRDSPLDCATASRHHRIPRWRRRSTSLCANTPPHTDGGGPRPNIPTVRYGSCSASRTPQAWRSAAAMSPCCHRSSTPPRWWPTCWPPPACWRRTGNPPWCAGSMPPSPTCPHRCAASWASGST
jgi:hypothetical protein